MWRMLRLALAPLVWVFEEFFGVALAIAIMAPLVLAAEYFPDGRPVLLGLGLLAYLVAVGGIAILALRRRARRRGDDA